MNHVDATADQLAARVIAESRGGKVIADIFQTLLDGLVHVKDQGLFLEQLYPEAAAYPQELKGTSWLASDLIYIVPAWNTAKVKKEEEPKQFEDFADTRWKSRLIAEPRDFQLLIGLARYKYKSDERATRKPSHYSSGSRPTTLNFTRDTRSSPNFWLPDKRQRA